MLHLLPDLTTSKKLATELVTISTLMQNSNIRCFFYSLYSGGIPRLLQAQIACLMSTEHDEINVHVVAVQSQVIANNFIHVCYWLKSLIQVENIKFGIFRLYQYLQAWLYLCANFQANFLHLTSRYSE